MEIKKIAQTQSIKGATTAGKIKEEKDIGAVKDQITLGGNDSSEAIKPHKKWLFINYVAADCNLTLYQMKNLDQQELVGSDENTHLVAYIDVGPSPNPMDHTWSNCRTYYITKDTDTSKLNSEVIAEHGRVDMSNPETLKKFVVDAIKKFPADYVALILNDHGGGFTGAMTDDSDGGFMSVPQIKQALSEAEKETGKKIDILGFDACLMAQTEVAGELKDTAHYMTASEESEGGAGWTYNEMLGKSLAEAIKMTQESLRQKINVEPEDFAKLLVKVNEKHQNDIPTFSAVDLTKVDGLIKATDLLAQAILKTDDKKVVKDALSKAEHYGGWYSPYKDFHDEYHFCQLITKNTKDPALKKAALDVLKAIETAVIANESSPTSYPNSHGLSIYGPTSVGTSGVGYGYKNLEFAKTTQWDEAIEKIAREAGSLEENIADEPKVWPDGSPRASKES